ncbi:MAG: hypothetical protein AAF654_10520 [Myxococcota bacterium]
MYNLAISIGAGVLITVALWLSGLLSAGEAAVPGVLVVVITYFVLARRSFKQMEQVFARAMKSLQAMPPKMDLAIATLEDARPSGRWQFGVESQIDSQIGMIFYLQQKFDKALPYFERSLSFGHWMSGAMLGVIHYKKKNHAEMKRVFEIVVKKAKKAGLAWNLYAYLLLQVGERDAAQALLVRALKKTDDDPRVKEALLAVQNGKKIKMKSYKDQWYQFHLERPPMQYQMAAAGGMGKVSKKMRRGR